MRLSPAHSQSEEGRPPPGGPSASRLPPLIVIVVLVAVYAAIGGYYAIEGSLPGVAGTPRLAETMPPRGGPERPESALLQPPGAAPAPGQAAAGAEAPADTGDIVESAPARPADAGRAIDPPAAAQPAEPETPPAAVAAPILPDVPSLPAISRLPAPSLDALPSPPPAAPLPKAPLPELLQPTNHAGSLPVIARDGRQPWQVYARPAPATAAGQPRLAVLVTGLGLSKATTEAAIAKLPADVSLAFSPYARDLDEWIRRARAAGHEVLIELPMEPLKFPARDPGPLGLLASLPPASALARLERVMGAGGGYVGVVAPAGSPFLDSPAAARVLAEIKRRGLLYVGDAGSAPERPAFVPSGQTIDAEPFRDAIDARLARLAAAARGGDGALAVTDPLPVAIERLALWLPGLAAAGIVLTPVSALAEPPRP